MPAMEYLETRVSKYILYHADIQAAIRLEKKTIKGKRVFEMLSGGYCN